MYAELWSNLKAIVQHGGELGKAKSDAEKDIIRRTLDAFTQLPEPQNLDEMLQRKHNRGQSSRELERLGNGQTLQRPTVRPGKRECSQLVRARALAFPVSPRSSGEDKLSVLQNDFGLCRMPRSAP